MIKFGMAGLSNSFISKGITSTIMAAKICDELNIDVFEYSFGRGVNMSSATAQKIKEEFSKHNVAITVHAPYFVNFANENEDNIQKSFVYVVQSAKKVRELGGDRVVVHPASQGSLTRIEANAIMKQNIIKLASVLDQNGLNDIKICWETMGKVAQMGTLQEIIDLCNLDIRYYPCIDFGHINAREQGFFDKPTNYEKVINQLLEQLPVHKVVNMHVHFSKIKYGTRGEIKHLTFADNEFGPDFEPLAKYLVDYELSPIIISESDGTQSEDALIMKKIYYRYLNRV